ncbi:MAG: hypothetical protein AAF146_22250 [Bacteroidota bacterium]
MKPPLYYKFWILGLGLLLGACENTAPSNANGSTEAAPPVNVGQDDRDRLDNVDQSPVSFVGTPVDWNQHPAVDPSLRSALSAYESGQLETATAELARYFGRTNFSSQDELHGYLVAAYDGAQLPDRAAIEVLRRDKRRQVWNYELKYDLSICLRKYALQSGFDQAIRLVEQLRSDYGEKLPSLALAVIPRNLMSTLQEGIHSQTIIEYASFDNPLETAVDQILDQKIADPFLDHLYYYRQQPGIALQYYPESILRDVLLFNAGYEQMRVIWKAERTEEMREMGYDAADTYPYPVFDRLLKYVEMEEGPLVEAGEKAIGFFTEYVENYPQRPHADDAAYWVAWVYAQLGRYDDCIRWIKRVNQLGNRDYEEDFRFPEALEVSITPFLSQSQLRALIESQEVERSPYHNESVIINLVERLSFEEALRVLEEPQYESYKVPGLVQLAKKSFQEQRFDDTKRVAQLLIAKDYPAKNDLKSLINRLAEIQALPSDDPRRYSMVVSGLRSDFRDSETAFRFIEQSLRKLGDTQDLSALMYLKIVMMRDRNPSAVEAELREMLRRYPQSTLADDALAELVYVQAMVLGKLAEAEATLDQLLREYPEGNARDNALNWVAMGYRNCCLAYCYSDVARPVACERAKAYYRRIQREFPLTRFAGYAMENLLELQ